MQGIFSSVRQRVSDTLGGHKDTKTEARYAAPNWTCVALTDKASHMLSCCGASQCAVPLPLDFMKFLRKFMVFICG